MVVLWWAVNSVRLWGFVSRIPQNDGGVEDFVDEIKELYLVDRNIFKENTNPVTEPVGPYDSSPCRTAPKKVDASGTKETRKVPLHNRSNGA